MPKHGNYKSLRSIVPGRPRTTQTTAPSNQTIPKMSPVAERQPTMKATPIAAQMIAMISRSRLMCIVPVKRENGTSRAANRADLARRRILGPVGRGVAGAVLVAAGCAFLASCSSSNMRHVAVRYDAHAHYAMRVGQQVEFDIALVDGQEPQARVCGYRDYGGRDHALERVGGSSSNRFKAVGLGEVTLCGAPAQAVERCLRVHCIEGPLEASRSMVVVTIR